MQVHSKQYCFKTLNPQQSPPSNLHGTLLLISSHDPSDIHSSNPPAITGLKKLEKKIITYQHDLKINFRSIHSHSELIVEFSVVIITVSEIRGYNDIINYLKICPLIVPEEFECWNALKTITDLLSISPSSCKSLVFETFKTIIVPKIRSKLIPRK